MLAADGPVLAAAISHNFSAEYGLQYRAPQNFVTTPGGWGEVDPEQILLASHTFGRVCARLFGGPSYVLKPWR